MLLYSWLLISSEAIVPFLAVSVYSLTLHIAAVIEKENVSHYYQINGFCDFLIAQTDGWMHGISYTI